MWIIYDFINPAHPRFDSRGVLPEVHGEYVITDHAAPGWIAWKAVYDEDREEDVFGMFWDEVFPDKSSARDFIQGELLPWTVAEIRGRIVERYDTMRAMAEDTSVHVDVIRKVVAGTMTLPMKHTAVFARALGLSVENIVNLLAEDDRRVLADLRR